MTTAVVGPRKTPVIAVFGGSEPLADQIVAAAKLIGAAVARARLILLTGGVSVRNGERKRGVKELALEGATAEAGDRLSWLGICREDLIPSPSQRAVQIDMRTYKHRRNYAEACICDGAIAFEGGGGTISEVLFALQLGRPVIVVGPGWEHRYPVIGGSEAALDMLTATQTRIGRLDVRWPYDAAVEQALQGFEHALAENDQQNFTYESDLPESAEEADRVVAQLLAAVSAIGLCGTLPPLP